MPAHGVHESQKYAQPSHRGADTNMGMGPTAWPCCDAARRRRKHLRPQTDDNCKPHIGAPPFAAERIISLSLSLYRSPLPRPRGMGGYCRNPLLIFRVSSLRSAREAPCAGGSAKTARVHADGLSKKLRIRRPKMAGTRQGARIRGGSALQLRNTITVAPMCSSTTALRATASRSPPT